MNPPNYECTGGPWRRCRFVFFPLAPAPNGGFQGLCANITPHPSNARGQGTHLASPAFARAAAVRSSHPRFVILSPPPPPHLIWPPPLTIFPGSSPRSPLFTLSTLIVYRTLPRWYHPPPPPAGTPILPHFRASIPACRFTPPFHGVVIFQAWGSPPLFHSLFTPDSNFSS